MKLRYFKHTDHKEVQALRCFFDWQGANIEFIDDASVLKYTKGMPVPVLMSDDDEAVAFGFFEITDYWREHGLTRC